MKPTLDRILFPFWFAKEKQQNTNVSEKMSEEFVLHERAIRSLLETCFDLESTEVRLKMTNQMMKKRKRTSLPPLTHTVLKVHYVGENGYVAVPAGRPVPSRVPKRKNIEFQEFRKTRKYQTGKDMDPVRIYYSKKNLWFAQCTMAGKKVTVRSSFPNPRLLKEVLLNNNFTLDDSQMYEIE